MVDSINSRYRIVDKVGRGAQASTFLAEDILNEGRKVLIKKYPDSIFSNRAVWEFRQLVGLSHPNIVKIHHLGTLTEENTKKYYIAEDWVEGKSADGFAAELRRKEKVDFNRWFGEFLLKAASTLHYIHRRGVLHRDIKPAHIIIKGDEKKWRLCFIDFGLASGMGRKTRAVCGTPGYMAPECLQGNYSQLSDLYALGAAAFTIAGGDIFGREGGRGRNVSGLYIPIDRENLGSRLPALNRSRAAVIERLLHPDPFERYPSAKALAEHLMTVLGERAEGETAAAQINRPAFVGRGEIIARISAFVEERLDGRAEKAPAAIVVKGPRGIGKSAIIEETKKRLLVRFAEERRNLPVIVESGLIGFLQESDGGQKSGSLSSLASGARSVEARIKDCTESIMKSAPDEGGMIFILADPRYLEAETLLAASSLLSFQEAAGRRLVFIVEWDSDVENESMERLSKGKGVETIEVNPLPEPRIRELLKSSLGEYADPSLVARISARSGGYPLFAVELASLAARKNFRVGEKDIPGAAREVIRTGVRSISGISRQLMTAVALARNSLDVESASRILRVAPEYILRLSSTLSRRGWLELNEENLSLHPLVVDAALDQVSPGEEETMHLKIARALSRGEGAQVGLDEAYHCFMGGDYSCTDAFIEAASLLERKSAYERGLALLENALDKNSGQLGAVGKLLTSRFLRATGNYEKALFALGLLDEKKEAPPIVDEKRFEEGATLRLQGKTRDAMRCLSDLLGKRDLSPAVHARSAGLLGRMLLDEGRWEEAVDVVRGALDVEPGEGLRYYLLEPYALSEISAGRYEKAKDILRRSLDIAVKEGRLRNEARCRGLMGLVHQNEGKYDDAVRCYNQAADASRRSGDIHAASVYNLNLGSVFMEQGNFAPAMEKYNEAIRALESIGGWRELAGVLVNAANLKIRAGDLDGARKSVARCSRMARHYGFQNTFPLIHMLEGDIAFSSDDFHAAGAKYAEAEALFAGKKNEAYRMLAMLARAEALVFAGRLDECTGLLKEVEDMPEQPPAQWIDDRRRFTSALFLAEKGEDAAAGIDLVGPALEHFKQRKEKDLILNAEVVLVKLLLAAGRKAEAGKHFKRAIGIADGIRRQSLILGYDPSRTNPYMKFIRKVIKMKDMSFGPFSGEESVTSDLKENKWARLAKINKRINSELRLRPLLVLILDTMIDITQAARGYIILKDSEDKLKIKCARNIDSERLDEDETSFSRSIVSRVVKSASPIITLDAASDEHLGTSESIVEMNLKSVMAVPLMAKGRVMGAVYVDNPYASNIFNQEDVQLLMTFADQAGIALENARLLTENMKREKKIERLNRRLEKLLSEQKVELDAMRETLERSLARETGRQRRYHEIVGESKPMQKIFRLLDRIVETDLPAVIAGASGTGKELVARAIHFNSRRKKSPFVTENCGAIPENLLESILFGHVKGAFTGADRGRPGLFEMADHGTLFLDEIDSMSLPMQTKLLRTLQDGVVRPLGGNIEKRVDVRVLAATGIRLDTLVKEGKFREDLFYRINVITIELPHLRERKEDIPVLVSHFVEKHSGGAKTELSRGAMKKLMDYGWPGNVRQLENEIMRSIVLSEGRIMEDVVLQDIPSETDRPIDLGGNLNLKENVEKLEKTLINAVLKSTGGNQSAAARVLGMSRFGLIKKMSRYGCASTKLHPP